MGRYKNQIEVDLLHKVAKLSPEETLMGFVYPNIKDIWKVDADQIVQHFHSPTMERRSRFFLPTISSRAKSHCSKFQVVITILLLYCDSTCFHFFLFS